ncbi:MAG TPA: RNA-binding protein [Planctomycetota bacterium]|nr:RNA-binding protein [Planctomycetota bacterium]
MKITVGNLSYRAVESDLRRLFSPHGDVVSVTLSRGSGTVELREGPRSLAAIRGLRNHRIHGRPITVSESEPTGAYLMDVQEEFSDFVR